MCRIHSATVFSPLGLACEYRDNGSTAVQGTAARSARALPLNLTLQPVCGQEARVKLTHKKSLRVSGRRDKVRAEEQAVRTSDIARPLRIVPGSCTLEFACMIRLRLSREPQCSV